MHFHPALQLLRTPSEMLVRCDGDGVDGYNERDEGGAFRCQLDALEEDVGGGHCDGER